MAKNSNLALLHKGDGVVLVNSYGPSAIMRRELGTLAFPTGRVVMCDPHEQHDINDLPRLVFARTVEPGAYPVTVFFSKNGSYRTAAFLEVRFSDAEPAKYVAAKTLFDFEHRRKGLLGYPVRNSSVGVMDGSIFGALCGAERASAMDDVMELFDLDDDADILPRCSVGRSADGTQVAVSLHVSSGIYYWYWGLDKKGKPCNLVADFFTFH